MRIPAHFSGCYALKPSAGRVTNWGIHQCNPGFEAIKAAVGPMGRSVADLEMMTRVLLDGAPELALTQTNLLPVPYRDVKLPTDRPLRFGFFLNDGFCAASPACERAVMETVEALRKAGHEVIEFEPTPGKLASRSRVVVPVPHADVSSKPQRRRHSSTSLLWRRQANVSAPCKARQLRSRWSAKLTSAFSRKVEIVLSFLKNDPAEAFMCQATMAKSSHNFSRWLRSLYCRYVAGDEHAARLLDANCGKSVNDVQRWMDKRYARTAPRDQQQSEKDLTFARGLLQEPIHHQDPQTREHFPLSTSASSSPFLTCADACSFGRNTLSMPPSARLRRRRL